jgi:acyl-CoA synthetase (AMP-forming)/AMP-acid ligase II
MQAAHSDNLRARIKAVFQLDPRTIAIQSRAGQWTWEGLARTADCVEEALQRAGIPEQMPVGWVAHNRPAAVAAFAALIMNGRMVVPLRPRQTSATLPQELTEQRLIAVVADEEDWDTEGTLAAAAAVGTFGIALTHRSTLEVRVVPQLNHVGSGPHRPPMPGYVLERLTSGTTGAPKRIPVREAVLIPSLQSGEQAGQSAQAPGLELKSSPSILLKPFSHAGGLFGLLLALYQARPMVLMEKFSAQEWALAIHRYQPRSASLVPAMIQMLLQEQIEPDLLRSLKAIRSGTAPLDPQIQAQFEARYGIPLLIDYGAAEFMGGVAGWSLADHRKFSATKRGSVGRARPDVLLKVTSADTDATVPVGQTGVLHIKCDRFGPDWHRTNDLACVDEDGFLYLHGRADDAINRGGFKILPDEVAAVLRRYPGIRDVAVVGKADVRLGQVPIAAIEMLPDVSPPDPVLLDAFAREHLTAYMIPKEYRFVAALPRTASMKISRPELKVMLGL